MNHLLKVSAFVLFAASVNAADLPTVVEGSEEYSQEQCIASNTDDCIQSVCMNSEAPDCTDQCKTSAEDKCKELAEE
jgi:hypothetical protein